jgi:hypothetical protein
MSKQIVKDIQEALLREITTLVTHSVDTKTNISVETTFDPFTGEPLPLNIEGNLYNSSSNPNQVDYPRIDLQPAGLREDRDSGRMISIWEDLNTEYRELIEPNQNRARVYETLFSGTDGIVYPEGLVVSPVKFAKAQPGYLLKIISGANIGTYTIVALDNTSQKLLLSTELVSDIQELSFNEKTRKLYLLNPTDTYAVRAGDIFVDSLGNHFKILHIDTKQRELYLDGSNAPSLDVGSSIVRLGGALKASDSNPVVYLVLDPDKPKTYHGCPATEAWDLSHPATPFDYFFTLEIKNKDQQSHIAMLDQMTHTIINRPRRQLKILVREEVGAESKVTEGPDIGWGQSVVVEDASHFRVNDSVWFVNKYEISENNQIIDVDYESNVITVRNKVPISFSPRNGASIVSWATLKNWSMLLSNDDTTIGQDNINNFYRQEYTFRIQGWKPEKTGVKTVGGITGTEITIESENKASVKLDI